MRSNACLSLIPVLGLALVVNSQPVVLENNENIGTYLQALPPSNPIKTQIFSSSKDVPMCGTEGIKATGDAIKSGDARPGGPFVNGVLMSAADVDCNRDLWRRFGAGSQPDIMTVLKAKQATIDCESLHLSGDMDEFAFDFEGTSIEATKISYKEFPGYDGRRVWKGDLKDSLGYLTLVWDETCDPDIFHLEVKLPNADADKRISINSVNDKAGDYNSVWLAAVEWKGMEEAEGENHHNRRRITKEDLSDKLLDPEIQSLDADIELLRLASEGDVHANEQFHKGAGRRLSDGTVLMPSGRVLQDGSTIRVLYLYTSKAMIAVGGKSPMESMILAGVVTANQAYASSGINVKVEVAAILPVTYSAENVGGMTVALAGVANGDVPGAHAARDTYQADLVQMVIDDPSYCGYGYIMTANSASFESYAYSVVYHGCFNYYSNIHEMSHNMGADHDYASASHSTAWNYGVGYKYCDDGSTSAPYTRTIMSYACNGSTRMPYFSSPKVYLKGRATGTSTADNVSVLNATRFTVANFRTGGGTTKPAPTPSPTKAASKPSARPMCTSTVYGYKSVDGSVCCAESCGRCGGFGCNNLPGGSSSCCGTTILSSGRVCSSSTPAPCKLTSTSTSTSTCKGIKNADGTACCASMCGTCGGYGCSSRPGGYTACCTNAMIKLCSATGGVAPCKL